MEHGNGGKPSYGKKRPEEKGTFNRGGFKGDRKPSGERTSKPAFDRKPNGERGSKPAFDRKPNGERTSKPAFDRKPNGERGSKPAFDRKPNGERAPFRGGKPPFDRKPADVRPQPHTPNARDVALMALKDVTLENAFAAQALDRVLNAAKLSDEDRRLAASLYYTSIENRLRIEHVLMRFMEHKPEPQVMEILIIAAAQLLFMDKIPDHAAVDEAVKQARRAHFDRQSGMVNGVLRSLIRARDAGEITLPDRETEPEAYISEKFSLALPLAKRLVAVYGVDEAEGILAWTPDRRTETIRPNLLQLRGAGFEAWMSQAGLEWTPAAVSDAYRVTGAGRLASHPGYRQGFFSIQGEASILAAQAVQAKGGMQILDVCAAPGGKTCLMAESMRGAGRVYAWDLHEHRVELIRAAANRLGLENIRPQVRDAAKLNPSLRGEMDAVLIDAPCSGLGVAADKPDIKYRLEEKAIDALAAVQKDILNTCCEYVRPGGLLVYSTCTILPEENEQQVRAFLAAHPEFEPDPSDKWLPEPLRGGFADGMIQILPSRDRMSGFFIARMRRKAESYAG